METFFRLYASVNSFFSEITARSQDISERQIIFFQALRRRYRSLENSNPHKNGRFTAGNFQTSQNVRFSVWIILYSFVL